MRIKIDDKYINNMKLVGTWNKHDIKQKGLVYKNIKTNALFFKILDTDRLFLKCNNLKEFLGILNQDKYLKTAFSGYEENIK